MRDLAVTFIGYSDKKKIMMFCINLFCRCGPFWNCLTKCLFLFLLLVFFGRGTSSFSALAGAGRMHLPAWLSRTRGGNPATHGASRADVFRCSRRGWLVLPGISQGDLATKIRLLLKQQHWRGGAAGCPARAGGRVGCLLRLQRHGWWTARGREGVSSLGPCFSALWVLCHRWIRQLVGVFLSDTAQQNPSRLFRSGRWKKNADCKWRQVPSWNKVVCKTSTYETEFAWNTLGIVLPVAVVTCRALRVRQYQPLSAGGCIRSYREGGTPVTPTALQKMRIKAEVWGGLVWVFFPKLTWKNLEEGQQCSGRWGEILPRPPWPGGAYRSRAPGRAG